MKSQKNEDIRNLILECRNRDDEAFSRLVSLYTPMMHKVISSFSLSPSALDECFAEACVALHSAVLHYDLEQCDVTFGLYARICVHHRLVDFLRSAPPAVGVEEYEDESVGDTESIEKSIVERETVELLMKSARTLLSDYEYRVLILHMQGYKTSDIARLVGKDAKSVDNAKSRLFRRLRGALRGAAEI